MIEVIKNMNPRQLSHELRNGVSPDLTRRRWIIGLSLLGAVMGKTVSLYQMGVIRHLPDPPIPVFNSSKVDAAPYAYSRFESPDGPMMVISYGLTAWLAAAGGMNRARRNPALPVLLAVKIVFDIGLALQLAREEWRDAKALCFYCQLATLASIISLPLVLPEARRALQAQNEPTILERAEDVVDKMYEVREFVNIR